MSKLGKLHLIPTLLGETNPERVVPEEVLEVSRDLIHFIAENEKTARRYLKKAGTRIPLNDLVFYPLNKRTESTEIPQLIKPLLEGTDMGLISEAGLAGIADPGATVVELCHKKGIQVIPHTGASSIILALIASGFNGQQFTFHGYLPIDQSERRKAIRSMEAHQRDTGYTQIFMETPFRNEKLFEELIQVCHPQTLLCIARNITTENEMVRTLPVQNWKKNKPALHKQPCIFVIGNLR
ncbi:SAM-dependent methyltransferase [Cryomorphaceae bacterium 1068]|nr:SAM-dependent methyltransferase [Cryomorphaceae bacterium 1068]